MSALVSHPTGNANLRAVLRGLENAGLLGEFHTTIALPPRLVNGLERLSNRTARLQQRSFSEAGGARVVSHPVRETSRQLVKRLGFRWMDRHERGWASVDAVHRALDGKVANRLKSAASRTPSAVYCYEDCAHATFAAAQTLGLARLYDLPIAYWRTSRGLLLEEAERWPDWAPTLEGLCDSGAKLERKDAELELADRVLVASTFTKRSLTDCFGDKFDIAVTPYGCPPLRVDRPACRQDNEPLRVLFVGHLNQRKGLADLIAALKRLDKDWRVTLAGPMPRHVPEALRHLLADPRCEWLGVLPHCTLLQRMQKEHVFVFPSIVEGFGMVITEAMAAALPVITTPHTAGPDLLTDGEDGFIVPIRDPDAIASRLSCLAADERLRQNMAFRALSTAADNSWRRYERQVAEMVKTAQSE